MEPQIILNGWQTLMVTPENDVFVGERPLSAMMPPSDVHLPDPVTGRSMRFQILREFTDWAVEYFEAR